MEKVRLMISEIGFTDNHADNYILILSEDGGNRRLPIVIPSTEAKAIAFQLEDSNPERPLIHDLFYNFVNSFGIEMLEVNITEFKNGLFSTDIALFDGEKEVKLSAKTADAMALALRFQCPIFASRQVMELAGINIEDELKDENTSEAANSSTSNDIDDLTQYSDIDLELILNGLVRNEEYELAANVRDELRRRKQETS